MSNTSRNKPAQSESTSFKRWDEYVTEADLPDFELPVDDEHTIHIKAPTGETVIEARRVYAEGDVEKQLALICGGAADEVIPLVKAAPAGVLNALVHDIMTHFGLDTSGEEPASSS